MLDVCGQLSNFHWKILALAGIWTRHLPDTKPICYQLSYPSLDCLVRMVPDTLRFLWADLQIIEKKLTNHLKKYLQIIEKKIQIIEKKTYKSLKKRLTNHWGLLYDVDLSVAILFECTSLSQADDLS